MKHLRYFLSLFVFSSVLLITGCQKEDEPTSLIDIIYDPGEQEFGSALGEKNGKVWESSAQWVYNLTDSNLVNMSFVTYEAGTLYDREAVDIGFIPLRIGTHEARPFVINGRFTSSSVFFLGADGDAIISGLSLDSTRTNFIEIQSYDPASTNITGTFTMHYEQGGSTRLSYENCAFEARLFRP